MAKVKRIGKAWGNALGGYKLQNRVGGKFSSGFSGVSKTSIHASRSKNHRPASPAARRAHYLDGQRKLKKREQRKATAKKVAVVAGGTAAVAVGAGLIYRGKVNSWSSQPAGRKTSHFQAPKANTKKIPHIHPNGSISSPTINSTSRSNRQFDLKKIGSTLGGVAYAAETISSMKKDIDRARGKKPDQEGVGHRISGSAPKQLASTKGIHEAQVAEHIRSGGVSPANPSRPLHDPSVTPVQRANLHEPIRHYDGGDPLEGYIPIHGTRASQKNHASSNHALMEIVNNPGTNVAGPAKKRNSTGTRVNLPAGDPKTSHLMGRQRSYGSGVANPSPRNREVIVTDHDRIAQSAIALSRLQPTLHHETINSREVNDRHTKMKSDLAARKNFDREISKAKQRYPDAFNIPGTKHKRSMPPKQGIYEGGHGNLGTPIGSTIGPDGQLMNKHGDMASAARVFELALDPFIPNDGRANSNVIAGGGADGRSVLEQKHGRKVTEIPHDNVKLAEISGRRSAGRYRNQETGEREAPRGSSRPFESKKKYESGKVTTRTLPPEQLQSYLKKRGIQQSVKMKSSIDEDTERFLSYYRGFLPPKKK